MTDGEDVYDELGMTRVVNANFPSTVLGGSSMPPEVMDAAREANDSFAWIWEMEERAGQLISDVTGAEAAHVTTGTFGALVLGAAACMAGTDRQKMAKLPGDADELGNEFLIQKCLRRVKYDRAITVAGGEYVPVGDRSGCEPEEIEAAITEDTAGIHYLAPGPGSWHGPDYVKGTQPGYEVATNAAPIEDVIEVANRNDVPIIVDAAGQSYPVEGFERYIEMGADLVCHSAKYFQGPNAAGFITGRKDLVDAAFYSNFIGCEGYQLAEPEVTPYLPDDEYTEHNKPRDPQGPNRTYSLGRGYKLDRADIVATVTALDRWVEMDHEKERFEPARERGRAIMADLDEAPGVELELGEYYYHVIPLDVTFESKPGGFVDTLERELLDGDPSIWPHDIGVTEAGDPTATFNLLWLDSGEEQVIADRLQSALS